MIISYFILSVLVVWRLTHLFSKEDGPFDVIFLIRKKAGTGFLASLIGCFYCLSIWIALPFGIWLGTSLWQKFLIWLALSGAACLLEQATTKNNSDEPPAYHED